MLLLRRPRVVSRFAGAMYFPVMLVDAPEGAGKSVAIRQFVETLRLDALTCSLAADDGSLVEFVRAFAEALESVAPGLRSSSATAIEYALQAAVPHEELASWIHGHLGRFYGTIIVDGLEYARADGRVNALVERLVESSPASIRWILTSRNGFALPVDEWIAQRRSTPPIAADDLRFTRDEAQAAAEPLGMPLAHVDALYDMTRGWPLAFSLALRIPDVAGDAAEGPPPDYDALCRRLVAKTFSSFDEPFREVLLAAAVLPSIEERVLGRLAPGTAWAQVKQLAAEGLLLSTQPDGSLRFQDLFLQFLLGRLEERGTEAYANAVTSAATALEAGDRIDEALSLLVKSRATQGALGLCERYGFQLLDRGRGDLLHAAMEQVTPAEQQTSSVLLAIKAIAESKRGRLDTTEAWFLQALQQARDSRTRAEIAYRYALDLVRHGRLDGAQLLTEYANDETLPDDLLSAIRATLATTYVLSGRYDDARTQIARALELLSSASNGELRAKIYHHVAWIALFTGDVQRAKDFGMRAVQLALESNLYEVAARADSVLCNVAYDIEDDCAATLTILDRILDCGLKAGSSQVRLYALLGSFDILAERGDSTALDRLQETLQSHEIDYGDSSTSEALLPGQALLLASRGEFAEAYRLLLPTGERQITPDRRGLRFSEIALYAAGADFQAEAIKAIDEVSGIVPQLDPRARRTIRTLLNLSVALYVAGSQERARAMHEGLGGLADSMSPRLRAFHLAISAIFSRWSGESNHFEVYESLQAMEATGFGGIAGVLAALPRRGKHAYADAG
ncbi:MAG TPA: tetratricopeptide repeat protein [Candidatus Baltobacteraceae bacterium]